MSNLRGLGQTSATMEIREPMLPAFALCPLSGDPMCRPVLVTAIKTHLEGAKVQLGDTVDFMTLLERCEFDRDKVEQRSRLLRTASWRRCWNIEANPDRRHLP